MRAHLRAALIGSFMAGSPLHAAAGTVAEWSETAIAAGYNAGQVTPHQSRMAAIVHVAMFDALNSIEPRYARYRTQLPARPGTSSDAAAAAAAYHVLLRLYPAQVQDLDAALGKSLAAVKDEGAKAQGVELGEQVAVAILAERGADGSDALNTYRPFTTAGTYVPTAFPVTPGWGSVKPFVLTAGNQFRPAAPYALTDAQWAKDYDEVKAARSRPTPYRITS